MTMNDDEFKIFQPAGRDLEAAREGRSGSRLLYRFIIRVITVIVIIIIVIAIIIIAIIIINVDDDVVIIIINITVIVKIILILTTTTTTTTIVIIIIKPLNATFHGTQHQHQRELFSSTFCADKDLKVHKPS